VGSLEVVAAALVIGTKHIKKSFNFYFRGSTRIGRMVADLVLFFFLFTRHGKWQ
jgi:hypothetical protein